MKAILKGLIIIMCMVYFAACDKSTDTDSNIADLDLAQIIADARGLRLDDTGLMSQAWELEQLGPIGQVKRSFEDIEAQYPDKTILKLWGICPSDYITDELNSYLVSMGCDYVVYFMERTTDDLIMLKPIINDRQKEQKAQHIRVLLDKADIMPVERDYFYDLIKEDYLEAWDTYLNTETGKKLYAALPENNWLTVCVNGSIYGINGRADYIEGPPAYVINKELMRKYELTEEDLNKPLYELGDIITMVSRGEAGRQNFCPLAITSVDYFNFHGISPSYTGSSALFLVADTQKDAAITLEDPEYISWLRAINEYVKQGLVGRGSNQLDSFFIQLKNYSSLPLINPGNGFYYNSKGELAGEEDVIEIVLSDYYDGSISYQLNGFYCNAISKTSKNKQQAFDFLQRVYTDSYITNLLLYGIENRNYRLTADRVDWPLVNINDNCIGNAYISYPRFFEYPDKKERYLKLQHTYPYVYYDFYFDKSKVEEELNAVNSTMNRLNELLNGKVEDFDKFISELKKELYDKGIIRLRDEINRQKNEWLRSK